MATRKVWWSFVSAYLFLGFITMPVSGAAQPNCKRDAERARNKEVGISDAKTGQVVAYLTLDPGDLNGGYVSVRDTEQHADAIADTSKLVFTLHSPVGERTLLTYGTYDSLVGLIASRYSRMVFTGWEGGSHDAIRVFQLRKSTVRLVFEATAERMPEVVWDGAGILVSRGHLMKGNEIWPTDTEFYVWDKGEQRYNLAVTVPYGSRYDALAKLVRDAEQRR